MKLAERRLAPQSLTVRHGRPPVVDLHREEDGRLEPRTDVDARELVSAWSDEEHG